MHTRTPVLAMFSLWLAVAPFARAPSARAQESELQAHAEAPAEATPAAATGSSNPLPGDDVMRPTEHGLRMTPTLARALSRTMVGQLTEGRPLAPEQRSEINARLAQRIMRTARTHQEMMQQVAEYTMETLMQHGGNHFTPESSREFGRRVGPMIPLVKEFVEGIGEDFEPIVDQKQNEALRETRDEAVSELDKIASRMDRWANGGYEPGESPFDNHSPQTQPAAEPVYTEMQQATHRVEYTMMTLEPTTWERFLRMTSGFFQFQEQQNTKAKQILAEYRSKADAIMTPEWKQRVRENRLKQQFRGILDRNQPVAPWFFHLQYEFDLANKPLRELGDSFRREVLSLATPQQRETALGSIRQLAGDHGLVLEDADRVLLGLE